MPGLYNVRNYIEFGAMDPKATTFAHPLKNAGYATAVCGIWQIGLEPDSPQKFGSDEAFLWWHMRRASRYPTPGFEHNGVAKDSKGGYGPKVANEFALDVVTRKKDGPFLLYYPMMLTHEPFRAESIQSSMTAMKRSVRSSRSSSSVIRATWGEGLSIPSNLCSLSVRWNRLS